MDHPQRDEIEARRRTYGNLNRAETLEGAKAFRGDLTRQDDQRQKEAAGELVLPHIQQYRGLMEGTCR